MYSFKEAEINPLLESIYNLSFDSLDTLEYQVKVLCQRCQNIRHTLH